MLYHELLSQGLTVTAVVYVQLEKVEEAVRESGKGELLCAFFKTTPDPM